MNHPTHHHSFLNSLFQACGLRPIEEEPLTMDVFDFSDLFNEPRFWPVELPPGLQYGDYRGIHERHVVIPSWNDAPLREVIRAENAVAVIDIYESDEVELIQFEVFANLAQAKRGAADILRSECQAAKRIYDSLPGDLKRGALVD